MRLLKAELEKAIECRRRGQWREAGRIYQSILRAEPANFEAAHGLGVVYLQSGQAERSERQFGVAVLLDPDAAAAHHDRGLALRALKRPADAVASYDRAIALEPGHAVAYRNRGTALHDLSLFDEAIASYDKAVALKPDDAAAHYQRGNLLLRLARAKDALASFDAAIAVDPLHAASFNNRANALRELNRPEEALADYDRAIALKPDGAPAFCNRGFALQDLGRLDEAMTSYNRAIALKPDFYEALKNRGTLKLLLGQMRQGFSDFEYRLRGEDLSANPRLRAIRPWSGGDPAGQSIVVHGDGAFGDLVQFSRYLPLLAAQDARVTLLAPTAHCGILSMLLPGIDVVSRVEEFADIGFRCEILSLPHYFRTELSTVPPCANSSRRGTRRADKSSGRFDDGRFSIGICWQGNPARNIDRGRSIPLIEFRAVAQVPGVRLVGLQKHHGLDQLQGLPPDMRVDTLGQDFDSGPDAFIDTAAAMAELDLVVTCDTAVAHLAATLGRPTWIALRAVPEWRWLLERNDSPWYPTVRLFRQKEPDRWAPVFVDIAAALRETVAAKNAGRRDGDD